MVLQDFGYTAREQSNAFSFVTSLHLVACAIIPNPMITGASQLQVTYVSGIIATSSVFNSGINSGFVREIGTIALGRPLPSF